jgi:hypothetical protein
VIVMSIYTMQNLRISSGICDNMMLESIPLYGGGVLVVELFRINLTKPKSHKSLWSKNNDQQEREFKLWPL